MQSTIHQHESVNYEIPKHRNFENSKNCHHCHTNTVVEHRCVQLWDAGCKPFHPHTHGPQGHHNFIIFLALIATLKYSHHNSSQLQFVVSFFLIFLQCPPLLLILPLLPPLCHSRESLADHPRQMSICKSCPLRFPITVICVHSPAQTQPACHTTVVLRVI